MTLISAVSQALSILTVIGQVLVALLAVLLFFKARPAFVSFFGTRALLFSFIVVLIAMLGSLFYSEIAGYEPCKLCWVQRIFMYSQVFLLGMALWKRDEGIMPYALLLSGVGAAIAGYHYLLQVGIAPELPCAAVGYSSACSQRFVLTYGYITIPMMAFTAFLLITVFGLARRYTRKSVAA